MSYILIFSSVIVLFISIHRILLKCYYYFPVVIVALYSFFIGLASLGLFEYSFAQIWSNNGVVVFKEKISIYSLIILFIYFIPLYFIEKVNGKFGLHISGYKINFNKNIIKKILRISSFFILILAFINIISLNFSVLWSNNFYLLIASSDGLIYRNPLTILIQQMHPLIGLISVLIFSVAYAFRDKLTLSIILLPLIFYFLMKIGDHSRYSALYVAAMMVVFSIFLNSRKEKIAINSFLIFFFFGNLINSLIGRESGHHGLASMIDYFPNIMTFLSSDSYLFILGNIFEGVFVHGEIYYYLNHEFPFIFKFLSLSPFPSFIDGYAENAHNFRIDIAPYVPMSATGEILLFGLGYMFIYYTTIVFSIYLNFNSVKNNNNIVFIFSLLLICLGTYLQFTYGVRNVFRFFCLAIIICLFFSYRKKFRWGSK